MNNQLISIWEKSPKRKNTYWKKIVKRLTNKKNKRIDLDANDAHKQVFSELDCLDCANCCKSIPPMLLRSDVRRIAKYLGQKEKDFESDYLKRDEDGDLVINTSPCPFLGTDNKCSIYEHRPKACRQYPHTDEFKFRKNAHLHPRNAAYCPAVFHILERLNQQS